MNTSDQIIENNRPLRQVQKEDYRPFAVEADSVADFLDKYYEPELYAGRGDEYAEALLWAYVKEFEAHGFCFISADYCKTGNVASYYGPEKPIVYDYETTTGAKWEAFVKAKNSGEIVEIDEEMWYYWLEVLPPIYMNRPMVFNGYTRKCFGFAEGCDYITAFWREKEGDETRHFCKLTEEMNKG